MDEVAHDLGVYGSPAENCVKQDRIDRGEQEGPSSEVRTRLWECGQEQRSCMGCDR
ncbi:hypothetical protein GCM10027563_23720 [Parasphingorhabdus pacifica]